MAKVQLYTSSAFHPQTGTSFTIRQYLRWEFPGPHKQRGLDFFWDLFFFCFFSVWLAFPCVFHWFSFIFLTCPCFPSVFRGFHCFSIGFTSFSSFVLLFSIGFPWFSLFFFHCFACIFLTFPWFSIWFSLVVFVLPLVLLRFVTFSLVLLHFHNFSVLFNFSCFSCFPASCVFHWFFALSSLFCCFYLGCVSLVFLFHWLSYIFLYIVVFPALVFVHCPHAFLLQLIWLVLVQLLLFLVVVVVAALVLSCTFCGLTAESPYDYACQWCCCLAVATWSNSRGPTIKKGGWGARGEGLPSPRNAFHAARRCLCAFASVVLDWHNVIVEKKVVCSFCCIAIVAFFQVLFAFALPLLWKRDGGQTTGKMNGTMKILLLLTVEDISVPPCLVSFFSSCSCCCSWKPQKPKKTKSIEKPGN